jgi:MFS family permease
MSIVGGAWLSAALGSVTGVAEAYLRRRTPPRNSVILGALAGGVIGGLAFATFIIAGFAVSLLTFSGPPDAGPALLTVIIGCAALLLVRGLHSVLAPRFGLPERPGPSGRRSLEDLISARPRGGRPTMWLGGVGFAALPMLYGIRCIVTRQGELGTLIWPSALEGGPAIALGVGWLGIGLFLHFHFFFGLHPRLEGYSRRGKSLALLMATSGLTIAGAWSVLARVPP